MDSTFPDPLEKRIYPERVNYENGVLLDENDFKDEQTYLRGRLGRALAFLHGSGTVSGLQVTTSESQPHVIVVMPGLALDPIGRLIELPMPYCIRTPEWFIGQNQQDLSESFANSGINRVLVDLFISFNVCPQGMTPYLGGGKTEGTDAFTYHRLLDSAAFELEIRTELPADIPVPDPFRGLPPIEPETSLNLQDALTEIRQHKYTETWDEDVLNGTSDNRVLLTRIQLPCTEGPMTYDTNGNILFDDSVRLLSLSTTELFWLINAMRGDQP